MSEAKNSTHRVEIVPVVLERHPNADALSVCRVYGYSCVCRTEDWIGVTKAAYLCPDTVVDVSRPEFSFLASQAKEGKARIKAKKLRGIVSFGLMIPMPDDAPLGEDMAAKLGVEHYEAPIPLSSGGEVEAGPDVYAPTYDVDALRRYAAAFVPGEPAAVTEKVDGANGRFVFSSGRMYCGSRTEWKKESETNMWWKALRVTPNLEKFCRDNPDTVVYGEVYGKVQSLNYGIKSGVAFVAFDIMQYGEWLDYEEARKLGNELPWVPEVGSSNTFDFERLCAMAEGPSLIPGAGHYREGVVVSPLKDRFDPIVGRVKLKLVSATYLEKA